MSDDAERERARYEALAALVDNYRRERDEAREQLDLTKRELGRWVDRETKAARERDEWRDKFLALNQTAGELCNACGWAFKIPGESCRCEVVKERDEARAEVEHAYREGGALYEAKIAEREAFRCGAEAMREACAQWVDHWVSGHVADKLRDMPIPEES